MPYSPAELDAIHDQERAERERKRFERSMRGPHEPAPRGRGPAERRAYQAAKMRAHRRRDDPYWLVPCPEDEARWLHEAEQELAASKAAQEPLNSSLLDSIKMPQEAAKTAPQRASLPVDASIEDILASIK